jgi:hypothetical protein
VPNLRRALKFQGKAQCHLTLRCYRVGERTPPLLVFLKLVKGDEGKSDITKLRACVSRACRLFPLRSHSYSREIALPRPRQRV